jgi:hypothetical protein
MFDQLFAPGDALSQHLWIIEGSVDLGFRGVDDDFIGEFHLGVLFLTTGKSDLLGLLGCES